MGRNLNKNIIKYSDRNSYYKAIYVDNWNIKRNSISDGVFYSKNISPITYQNIVLGNIKYKLKTLQIETLDNINLYPDDYVLHRGEVWRVKTVVAEENEKEKRGHIRVSVKTTIALERKV